MPDPDEVAKQVEMQITGGIGRESAEAWRDVKSWKCDHVGDQRVHADIVSATTVPDTGLYALTLWQPWATAIVEGPKNVENRDWRCPKWLIGRYLVLHAAKTWDKDAVAWLAERGWQAPRVLPQGAIIGIARVDNCVTESESPFFFGPYGWVLSDRQATKPIYCPGHQKLWRVPASVRAELERRFPFFTGGGRVVAP